jgi:hypothetical protein
MEKFCSGIPPSYSQFDLQSPVTRTAPAGRPKDAAEGASKP